jgi:hypothetical protein
MNMYAIGCTALIGVSLFGCSHPNPLLTAPKEKVVEFIHEASDYATKATGHPSFDDNPYYLCHYNPAHFDNPFSKEENWCKGYFKAMAKYAKTSTIIQGVTLSDLEDHEVFMKWGDALSDFA